ncbi:MAG: SDR family NAD(P)-dependent oxidoreductase [Ilumatobacteraceae bacterium]|jgi:NAD(P)-dependent dehydrogenase (short-subunit alcohol dehydrogenase family)|nr:SDR family oxidoreductase [Actinomycetota bacterium]MDA3010937.1 SDR family oxidoreductase [Actinomycetota bacterium]MDA3025267.1 SDR family oxidoreductase [Actinomycetota bacterium]NBU54616.1 SDR family oxidoreductase [Acidimicrobiia bacterium]
MSSRPVAVIADARFYVGPELCRHLAARGFDMVVGDPTDALVEEIRSHGVQIVPVPGGSSLDETACSHLVSVAIEHFGRIDSAVMFSGDIVTGPFVHSTIDHLRRVVSGCLEAPYHFLRALTPLMADQGSGQVLVITSAAGARPTPDAPLYSAVRAGATMLVKNVAAEVASHGVQVNAVGTNFMDFPGFLSATGATDPAIRARIEARVPMRRLGTMEEFAAFCMVFLDGSSRFTTGQFVAYAGGWA